MNSRWLLIIAVQAACWTPLPAEPNTPSSRVPVIDVTDLYHPPQDPGDNLDLIAAYALPEVDLRAIVLDVTEEYRKPSGQVEGLPRDEKGPREPGFIPVQQLNRVFNRNVPCAAAPFSMMKTPDDRMLDAPAFEQAGIELLLRTLRDSTQPVEIVSFGSGRPVAVASNREPQLFAEKVKLIHLSAGSSEPGFMEWNVMLDQKSIICLLRSKLPVAIYPCGTKDGAFAYGPGNTFWRLPDLQFVAGMAPPLQRYLSFAFEKPPRLDFLRAVEEESPAEFTSTTLQQSHNVWETGIWLNVTGRKLVRHSDGSHDIVAAAEVRPTDNVLPNELKPCEVTVDERGEFTMRATTSKTNKWMYDRGDPRENENALRHAFPKWYGSIRP